MSLSRRELLRAGMSAALLLARPQRLHAAENTPKEINQETLKNTRDIISVAKKMGGVDTLGYRRTDAWKAENGLWYQVYQRAILEKTDHDTRIFKSLDVLSGSGLDEYLDRGEFNVTIPPRHNEFSSEKVLSPEEYIKRFQETGMPESLYVYIQDLKKKGLDPGLPCSYEKDYGSYSVWRFQGMAFQVWKDDGRIEGVLVGEAAFLVGMVPEESTFLTPQLDLEPEFRVKEEQERFQPTTRGGRANGCAVTSVSKVGECTYYSHAGCVGCGPNQIMRNGKPFREMEMTMAYDLEYLGETFLVENLDNGRSAVVSATDTGGFRKYGILADLSLGVARAIGLESRRSKIRITLLKC